MYIIKSVIIITSIVKVYNSLVFYMIYKHFINIIQIKIMVEKGLIVKYQPKE